MSVAQTVHPKENEAHAGGQDFVRIIEATEQTPHETEEFLTREQAINELLLVHDEEEARRQKCLARYLVAVSTLLATAILLAGISTYFGFNPTQTVSTDTAGVFGKLAIVLMTAVNLTGAWSTTGWRKNTLLPNSFCALISEVKKEDYTPAFSSPLQQNVVTAMLIYSDEPRITDALCRALEYYQKDKNRLYVRLARLLPLLPSDGSALSEIAQRTLFNTKNREIESATGNESEQTLPVLQAAAKEYFARTGEPALRPKRKWRKRQQGTKRRTKEIG